MRKPIAACAVLAAGALAVGTLTACNSEGGKAVKVVATTTQVCDYATQIASDPSISLEKTDSEGKESRTGNGETIKLTCLLAPNASAHNHEMTPKQMKALADADILLTSGVDLEHFLDGAVQSSGFHGKKVVTSGVEGGKPVGDGEHVDIAKWPFPPEEGESEPEFQYDPHVWTSPRNAEIQVSNVGKALADAAEHPEPIKQRTETFRKQLEDLDGWTKKAIDSVPKAHRVLFTSHDAFGYFSRDYQVKFIGAALSDFNEQQDATADHIKSAVDQVKASGANALFAENSNNPKSIEAIAKAAGVRAVIGDDALYGDSLGPVGSDGETYIGSITHNVTNLTKAWQGKVPELPESLRDHAPKDTIADAPQGNPQGK